MKATSLIAGVLLILVFSVYAEEAPKTAKATLRNASGDTLGKAVFIEDPNGVKIVMNVYGFPPGPHGFHIHTTGQCDPSDFASAGGHFNPHGKKHGLNNPDGSHAGDLPNLIVAFDGTATGEWFLNGVYLGSDENSLLKPGGTALVIHENADDGMTDPSGNSGPRIACGVIAK